MMIGLKIEYSADAAKKALRDAPMVVHRHLEGAVDLALALLHGEVQKNIITAHGAKPPAVAFGYLANAVATMSVPAELHGEVFISSPADVYAAPVETGTKPHWPPRQPLERWVEKKFVGLSEKEIKSVAFLIARKISKRGTQGHFMFQRAFAERRADVETLFDQAIVDAIEEIGKVSSAN